MDEKILTFAQNGFLYTHTTSPKPRAEHFFRHCHELYELIYVKNGSGKYIVEGAEYNLHPHSLLLIPPREYHYVHPEQCQVYERYVFNFDRRMLPSVGASGYLCLGDGAPGMSRFYDSSDIPCMLPDLLCETDTAASAETPHTFDHIRLLLSRILLLLSEVTPEKSISASDPLGTRVIRYLNENLTTPVLLDDLAARFFVSKFHLCRAFKERNGISVMDYLCHKRILLAKQLIAEGENAYTAAYRVGFNDYSTFFRSYKKVTGTSPMQQKSLSKACEKTVKVTATPTSKSAMSVTERILS